MFEPRRTMFFFIFTKNHIVFVSVILHPNRLKLHMKLRFIVLMLRADVAQNGKKMRALRALIFFRIFYLTSSVYGLKFWNWRSALLKKILWRGWTEEIGSKTGTYHLKLIQNSWIHIFLNPHLNSNFLSFSHFKKVCHAPGRKSERVGLSGPVGSQWLSYFFFIFCQNAY